MAKKLEQDVFAIRKFKQFIHGREKAHFQAFSKNDDAIHVADNFYGVLTAGNIARIVDANKEGMELAMMINQSNGKSRSASNVVGINALFADFDKQKWTRDALLKLPIAPQLIVETSPNKFHSYWLIKDCEANKFKAVMKALAYKLGSDPNIIDPSRVMRIPGTVNWKYKKPFLARIIYLAKSAESISMKDFLKRMKLRIGSPNTGAVKPARHRPERLTNEISARIKDALEYLPSDDRDTWQKVGMAIHSVDQSERGYKIWKDWAKASSKFNAEDQRKRWGEFSLGKGINLETLFWLANQAKYGKDASLDEMSLAGHFVETYKSELRYDRDNKIWYHFSGVVWESDCQAPIRLARKLILAISIGKSGMNQSESVKRFRSAGALKGIVSHAELLDSIHATEQLFDRNPNVIAVSNGVVDLISGEFRTARASDYIRHHTDVGFDSAAKCPAFIKFMKSITCGDRELYEYIRRALGYTLFGHADQQIFFLAVGTGSNGKGVLMRTIQKVLGEYAVSVPPNLLTTAYSGNVNSPSPALARLCGARMVVCTELPTGRRFDEAFVKQYAGADEITARHGYGTTFSFKPEGKLWLSTNEVPEISAKDEAMWRRIKPIPFAATFSGKGVDHKLEEKLAAEHPGILNWLLKGAKFFHENGLGSCPAIDDMQSKLRKQADSLFAWMSECCMRKPDAITQSSVAYASYTNFMRNLGRKALSQPAFRAGLADRGIVHKKRSSSNFYVGFRLQE